MKDTKEIAGLILAGEKRPAKDVLEEELSDESPSEGASLMKELRMALRKGDDEAAWSALEAALALCSSGGDDLEEEELSDEDY